jgi:glycerol-3-phosphate dehydrogenase subunit C
LHIKTGEWIDKSHEADAPPAVEDGLDRGLSKKKPSMARLMMAKQDVAGPVGSAVAPLVNAVTQRRGGAVRKLMQTTLGVDANAVLPQYASETFVKWFSKRRSETTTTQAQSAPAVNAPKVLLYVTCFVNHNRPEIGKAVVSLLEASGVHVECCFPGW